MLTAQSSIKIANQKLEKGFHEEAIIYFKLTISLTGSDKLLASQAFNSIALIHESNNNIGMSIVNFIKAHELNPECELIIHKLTNLLYNNMKDFLLLEFKKLPPEIRYPLLKDCLNGDTIPGERFYTPDKPGEICDVNHGILKIIYDYLDLVDRKYVTTFGMFFDVKAYDECNKKELFGAKGDDIRFSL